jgi:hypothetical protein
MNGAGLICWNDKSVINVYNDVSKNNIKDDYGVTKGGRINVCWNNKAVDDHSQIQSHSNEDNYCNKMDAALRVMSGINT